jgi:hypothetical protein
MLRSNEKQKNIKRSEQFQNLIDNDKNRENENQYLREKYA